MPEPLYKLTAAQLSKGLADNEFQSADIVDGLLQRVQAVDGKIQAFLGIDEDKVRCQAEAADQRRAAGNVLGPLDGIPVALKDLIAEKDAPLSSASRILENYVSPYDATVTRKLREAGAILFGRLNMDEFAMGSSTENSAFQKTCNPWNTDFIPGGSSGGSAASVAALETPLSLGSDTGGSIRQPASHCGVVGLKPSYGRVSRYGIAAFASSLDQIGPMARTVEDAAMLLQSIAGKDPRDSTSTPEPVPNYTATLNTPLQGKVIGMPRQYFEVGLRPEVQKVIEQAAEFYRSQGCKIVEVDLPHTELAVPVYYVIATAEASSNLSRYDGIRYGHRSKAADDGIDLYFKSRGEGFGEEVKRRIILGTYVLSSGYYDAYYLRAQKARTLIRNDFLKAFEQVDVLLAPTAPTPAFRFGEHSDDPLSMYLADIYTISVNLAGLPGISVPAGFSDNNLPIGLQLIAPPFAECRLLNFAHHFEAAHGFANQAPKISV
jgi:aspartyl-tRNA(Asn)/glutamyl-tRNA(Gln) amidotransferase subunit A